MISPGNWLGLLGGGQLGRMFTMAAQSMGYRVVVVDPSDDSPAGSVADEHIRADYLDPAALRQLASRCQAVTTEFENVPAEALRFLADHCFVSPTADSVAIAQDRIEEKRFIMAQGIDVAPHAVVRTEAELGPGLDAGLLPGILKRARLGYDGKGQVRVATLDEAAEAFDRMGAEPCVLEQMLDLKREVSVVVARTADGQTATWPLAENYHFGGILDTSVVPARVSPELADQARRAALTLAERMEYRGVLCVEFFVVADGRLVVNEIAPRPHNSGHYTIDACITSQFEQQARILARLPLGDTSLHCPAVMVNILGDAWREGEPDWAKVLRHPRAKLHLYGKRDPRPGRKMGHYTVLGDTVRSALDLALAIRSDLKPGLLPDTGQ